MSRVARIVHFSRNFATSSLRRAGAHDDHDTSGIAGSNLPFKINNKIGLTIKFAIFFSSGSEALNIASRFARAAKRCSTSAMATRWRKNGQNKLHWFF
ncbi:hypothetical protein V5799_032262 [Amblyomma americanum]|uniref:Uncharacterized protein n=1 Tax=Amblyomma americanum TaxID=6943 RepID=A0AAQ4DRP1_AMBAM